MSADVRKLLGGYATGTLTPGEQKRLFEAALSDQDLFNVLADEQVLKDYLDDPKVREELLGALDPAAQRSRQPQIPGLLFSGAVAAATLFVFVTALHPTRERVATFTPPPLPPRKPAPVVIMPMDPPPYLVRQPSPNAALAAIARIEPEAEAPPSRTTATAIDVLAPGAVRKAVRAGNAFVHTAGSETAASVIETALDAIGKVTDVDAGNLTLDLGTKAGVKQGDRATISRDGVTLGTVILTTAAETSSVGRYTGVQPKIGDRATLNTSEVPRPRR